MKKILLTTMLGLLLIATQGYASQKEPMHKGSHAKKGSGSKMMMNSVSKPKAHAAILNYIAKKSGDNGEYKLDGMDVTFGYLHKGLKPKNGTYVSCVDYTAGKNIYDVDYYVEKKGSKYYVTKEILHKKNGEKINKVLWKR